MELDVSEQEVNDPASKEFVKLRREVAMMRLAIEKLADEPAKIEIPDYTDTLGDLTAQIKATSDGLQSLLTQPALAVSPQNFAKTIAAAGVEARKQEQAALDQATATFVTVANQLTGFVASARKDQEQIKWLLWTAAGSAILGALLWTALSFIANSLAPESWHWPEKTAAHVLSLDMWEAGQRLMVVANPEEWHEIETTDRATKDSRAEIARCQTLANKAHKIEKCTLNFLPEAKNKP
jgi:Family of unknown function (DUF6118)